MKHLHFAPMVCVGIAMGLALVLGFPGLLAHGPPPNWLASRERVCARFPASIALAGDAYGDGHWGLVAKTSVRARDNAIPDDCEQTFIRASCDADGVIDVADLDLSVSCEYEIGLQLSPDTHDVKDESAVDVAEPVYLLAYLYSTGPPTSAPFPKILFGV